jgi:predicted phage-related endonuclease
MGNYGDYLVGVPFHRDTKKFERQVVILKMPQADNMRLTLTRETVGKLQPIEVKTAEVKQ